jgi:hypothetical protein
MVLVSFVSGLKREKPPSLRMSNRGRLLYIQKALTLKK